MKPDQPQEPKPQSEQEQPEPAPPPAVGYHPEASVDQLPPKKEKKGRPTDVGAVRGSHPGDRYLRVTYPAAAEPELPAVAEAVPPPIRTRSPFMRWLLKGHIQEINAPYEHPQEEHTQPWWKVMCLTGVDYFSTLGYQPGIAALAAGALAPIATLVLVIITLVGALPMYARVANESPHGDGSISMLERLLPWWQGKLFVLALLGFVATGFVITITLSAADATAHIVENPFAHGLQGYPVLLTLALIGLLGAVFLKGFNEAIGIAIGIVAIYLALNVVVIVVGFMAIIEHPETLGNWQNVLFQVHGNPLAMFAAALLLFPKLALGLSGFETGVVVMPLVKGDASDSEANPVGRIRNTRKLLATAALLMSVLLSGSSLVTTVLIPAHEFEEGGAANGRALAYLAHERLGDIFGTIYDISTITILWFAGASALAGLLNIVPRYLPRYGMAPDWARATRPLVLIFVGICFIVTIAFHADVDSQAGAYATGVLALITSATIAVTLSAVRRRSLVEIIGFGLVTVIFIYTTVMVLYSEPEGLKIAGIFIGAIIITSLISRIWRTTELRVTEVIVDDTARRFIEEASRGDEIHLIANHPDERNAREYLLKDREQRADNNIPHGAPVLFIEVLVRDASEFAPTLRVSGESVGDYRVLRAEGASVPNSIAAFLLWLRDMTGKRPHVYFGWTEGNPIKFLARYILFGEGDTAPLTHEVLRKAERDPTRRPAVHVG